MSAVPIPVSDEQEPESSAPAIAAVRSRVFPDLRTLLDPRAPYLIPLLLVVVTRGISSLLLPHASEDAYITYRYARNFAQGLGPVFNPGEHVMGFTSPLWMVWNALGWIVTRDPVGWSRIWTTAADAMTIVCGAQLMERHLSRRAAWCFAFAIATWIAFTGIAVSGMENGVLVALVFLTAAMIDAGRRGSGLVLTALALTRPEGVLAALLLGVRAPRRERWTALILVGLALTALALYFGSPLPNSVTAKAGIYGLPGPWAGRHWWEWAFPFALGRWPVMPDASFLFLGTVLFAPAAWEGARELWRLRRTPLALAVASLLAIWAGYALSGITYFFWYMAAPLAAWFALAAAGFPRMTRSTAATVSAALLILGCWTVVWALYTSRARAEQTFAQVADYLNSQSQPGDRVLLEPIGLIGYRTGLGVIDEVGLVTPGVARRRLRGAGWMTDVLAVERPQWIVIRRGVVTSLDAFAGAGAPFRDATDRDRALAPYRPAVVVDDAAGSAALVVLRRTGS